MHSISFVYFNLLHLTNWLVNGLPERFPNLKVIWIESGIAWLSFLMQRLDSEYMMRPSEAPLLKKRPEIVQLCHAIKDDLRRDLMAVYDDTAAIGKLYRRQDEIGTPWCICVDVESLDDGAVTVRDRDSMEQERIGVDRLESYFLDKLRASRP